MSSFGFGASPDTPAEEDTSLVASVQGIKPRAPSVIDRRQAKAVADAAGFESREAATVVRRNLETELQQQLNMRVPISSMRRFAKFADDEGLSYPKAFVALLARAGL